MTKTGVVIGKFYPPHRGHRLLIEAARDQVDELTVIVCHREDQRIPGELRAAWIREMVTGVRTVVVPDLLPADDSMAWAKYTVEVLGAPPSVAFTSEEYGETYAAAMGSSHVLVDRARSTVPISASEIRRDPLGNWEFLDPWVRAFFAIRIVLLGAESSGTTTLAEELAHHYETIWVPEFGRLYWEGKRYSGGDWRTGEFLFIAKQQNRLEDELAKWCNRLLICDTDSFATSLWHERYVGHVSTDVDAVSAGREPHLYLLTDIDIPFVQDGARDGEHIRGRMHRDSCMNWRSEVSHSSCCLGVERSACTKRPR